MAVNNTLVSKLRRNAEEVKWYRRWMRLAPVLIGITATVILIAYVVSVLYSKFGAFTVMVNKFDNIDYALTLSETPEFTTATSRLNAEIDKVITNIDGADLPVWLDNVDGEHNGENYVAYTFYVKNSGIKTFTYSYELYIANMTFEIEQAVRVRLYVNGEYIDYAYPRTDGGTGPEPGTVAFMNGTTIVKKNITDFKPGDITKFTVVIWLHGPDPECTDKILGGQFKIDMAMEVIAPTA